MGEPAAGDASGRAGGVERRRVHLDLLLGRLDRERRRARAPRRRGGRGGEAGGAGEGPRRRRGVEEAREERLAGQVGERHSRRDSEGSLGWANPLGGGGAPCARAVAWIWRKGNGRGGGGAVQVSRIYFGGRDDARFAGSGAQWKAGPGGSVCSLGVNLGLGALRLA